MYGHARVRYPLMFFPLHIPSFLRVVCGHSLLSFVDMSLSCGFKNPLTWLCFAPFSSSATLSSLHIPSFFYINLIFLVWHYLTHNSPTVGRAFIQHCLGCVCGHARAYVWGYQCVPFSASLCLCCVRGLSPPCPLSLERLLSGSLAFRFKLNHRDESSLFFFSFPLL